MTLLDRARKAIHPGSIGGKGRLVDLCQQRRTHRVGIDQALVLVSQISRSGGTLLSQLLSGHPDVHGHPGELTIGHPKKDIWPELDLAGAPRDWLQLLFEERLHEYAREGFVKMPEHRRQHYAKDEITFPFLFLPGLMEELFLSECAGPVTSQRQVLDAYFTAYFNAWLDYQGLYQPKRYVTAFTPKLALRPDSVERFFRDYPDGRMISIVRDPKSWFVSLRGKKEAGYAPADALPKWLGSAESALANKERYGDRLRLLSFEDLLGDTEGTMRGLAAWLDLSWDEILCRPTFQGMNIRANSSFKVEEVGVLDAPLKRAAELDAADVSAIEAATSEIYERVLAAIESDRA